MRKKVQIKIEVYLDIPDPYEELFFYGLIPFATEDGHTGLAFRNVKGSNNRYKDNSGYRECIKKNSCLKINNSWPTNYRRLS